jgi:MFS transporter, OFA family, oxalate/formate antiporter
MFYSSPAILIGTTINSLNNSQLQIKKRGTKMRYAILAAAVLMQMCLGATYSWSVYVQPLKALAGLQQGPAQIPFTIFYFIFPLTMMLAGNLLPPLAPRVSAMLGGLCFGGGWLLASLGTHSFFFTMLGIGFLAGIGAGLAYTVPITVSSHWFPNNKGLVAGIAVAGFGGGAALISKVGGWLMTNMGKTPFEIFFIFGLVFLVTVVCAGAVMHLPPARTVTPPSPKRITVFLTHSGFKFLYGAMLFGLAAGFAVNANLKEMYRGPGNPVEIGITAVSLFAIANACGRVIWGFLFDRVPSAIAIQANLLLQAVTLSVAPFMLSSPWGFWTVALLTGFNYGGVLVIYVSSTSRCWGTDQVGRIYGWLFSSNIPASLAPLLAGIAFDIFHTFTPTLLGFACLLLIYAIIIYRYRGVINQKEGPENLPLHFSRTLFAARETT